MAPRSPKPMACQRVHDLPTEIWLSEVVPRVDPIDVLFLGQKSIWVDILRSTCRIHGLFFASYPTDEMTLSELQRASTGPNRWDSLVRMKAVPIGELRDAPPLPILASGSLGDWDQSPVDTYEVQAFIVPGGRFFIDVRAEGAEGIAHAVRLELWDLGIPMRRTNAAPTRVASRYLEKVSPGDTDGDVFVTASREDPDELRVAVSSQDPDMMNGLRIRVFSISPACSTPCFEPLASVHIKEALEPSPGGFMHGDFMALRGFQSHFRGNGLILWNYVEGRIMEVPLGSATQTIFGDVVIITNDHLLHLREGVSMWSLSRLYALMEPTPSGPISVSSMKAHLGLLPDWTCHYPPPFIRTSHLFSLLNTVRCTVGTEPSVTFDILTGRGDLWTNPIPFHRYTLIGSPTGASSPFHFSHVEKGTLPFGHIPNRIFLGGKARNNGVSITCITPFTVLRAEKPHSRDQAFICMPAQVVNNTGTFDGEECSQSPPTADDVKRIMVTPLGLFEPLTSCWASGRFVCQNFDRDRNCILLADYL